MHQSNFDNVLETRIGDDATCPVDERLFYIDADHVFGLLFLDRHDIGTTNNDRVIARCGHDQDLSSSRVKVVKNGAGTRHRISININKLHCVGADIDLVFQNRGENKGTDTEDWNRGAIKRINRPLIVRGCRISTLRDPGLLVGNENPFIVRMVNEHRFSIRLQAGDRSHQ